MRQIPSQLLADLQADSTSLAFIWSIQMNNGRVIRGTEHDLDITIPSTGNSPEDPNAGTYYAVANVTMGDIASTSDMSVDNLEVNGALAPLGGDSTGQVTVLDVTVDDIEAKNLDSAPVTIMICNWRAPSHGYFVVKGGILGAVNHDSDGKYTTEVRGLTQRLTQTIIRTFSTSCNVVKFGDVRCKFPVASHTISGSVANHTANNLQQFEVNLEQASPPSGYSYVGGTLTFTSGLNTGYFREVKIDPNANLGIIQFWDQFPEQVQAGDEFTLSPGCDRQFSTCRNVYNNLLNNRAYGNYIPGINAITSGPTSSSGLV